MVAANIFLLFFASLFVCYILMPAVMRLNILDRPNERKIHENPTPKAGGLAVYFASLFALGVYYILSGFNITSFKIIVLAFLMMSVGFIDDYKELRPKVKLLLQILLAIITVYLGFYFQLLNIAAVDYLATIIWIVGFVNAFNLLDGMDGLAPGVFFISMVGFLVLLESSVFMAVIIAFLGAGAGFLYYNYPPASIFLGDTGSLLLGYLLALLAVIITQTISVNFLEKGYIVFFILFIPIFDTALTIVRRYIHEEPIFKPDRSHFYNLLQDLKGFTTRQVIYTIYLVNVITVLLSLLVFRFSTPVLLAVALLFIGIVIYLVIKNNFLIVDSNLDDSNT